MHNISNLNPMFPPFQLFNILIFHHLMLVNVSFHSIVLSNSSNDIRQLDFLRCISCIRPQNTKQGCHFCFILIYGTATSLSEWKRLSDRNTMTHRQWLNNEKKTICFGKTIGSQFGTFQFPDSKGCTLHTTFLEEMHKIFSIGSINGTRQQVSYSNREPIRI